MHLHHYPSAPWLYDFNTNNNTNNNLSKHKYWKQKSQLWKNKNFTFFLCPNLEEIPIDTEKFIAKVQSHMVKNMTINFPGKYKPNFICQSCKLTECNQSHLLYCSELIGSNELITYIPYYEDIFNDEEPKEQCFIANVMIANLVHLAIVCCCKNSFGFNNNNNNCFSLLTQQAPATSHLSKSSQCSWNPAVITLLSMA